MKVNIVRLFGQTISLSNLPFSALGMSLVSPKWRTVKKPLSFYQVCRFKKIIFLCLDIRQISESCYTEICRLPGNNTWKSADFRVSLPGGQTFDSGCFLCPRLVHRRFRPCWMNHHHAYPPILWMIGGWGRTVCPLVF